jgi:hypothetical protein
MRLLVFLHGLVSEATGTVEVGMWKDAVPSLELVELFVDLVEGIVPERW